ncbi:MAG: NUDIX domain-containing protein [Bacteroidota bacterium]
MTNPVHDLYGNRTRIRVCGLCLQGDRVLMVNHSNLGPSAFWAPPGGGVDFGETLEEALVREMKEETGLDVSINEMLFICELVKPPLHAVEVFFKVEVIGGQLITGTDPESGDLQIIRDVRFVTETELYSWPANQVHGIFQKGQNIGQISRLRGYFKL